MTRTAKPRGRPPGAKERAWTADQVRAWRAGLGWTQEQAAAALGVNRAVLVKYEAGGAPLMAVLAMQRRADESEGKV